MNSFGGRRKDLQDLQNLSRSPLLSYLQKQAKPQAPRNKTIAAVVPPRYPILAAFSPTRIFKWISEYLSHRIGPRHPFLTYAKSDPEQGVYRLRLRSEEHTSELQSHLNLVCRLLLEKKKKNHIIYSLTVY